MLATRWLPRRRTALRSSVLLIGPVVLYLVGHPARHRRGLLRRRARRRVRRRRARLARLAAQARPSRRAARARRGSGGRRSPERRPSSPGAIAIGAVAGLALAPVSPDRFVLRDEVVPPFDPLEFPSPLVGFRNYTKDLEETPLFDGDRARAGRRASGSRRWTPTPDVSGTWPAPTTSVPTAAATASSASTLPEPPLVTARQRATRRGAGRRATTTCGCPRSATARRSASSTAARATGAGDLRVQPDHRYGGAHERRRRGRTVRTRRARRRSSPRPTNCSTRRSRTSRCPPVENVPDVVSAKADEYVGEATTPIEQLRAIETGAEDQRVPQPRAAPPTPCRRAPGTAPTASSSSSPAPRWWATRSSTPPRWR